ncbi:MAG: type I-E CRISPR-associated protein Cas5/CasD [Pseudomonadota bacterium]
MECLVMRLTAPLASWGEPAVGEYRPSADWPGQTALMGLLGAALGLDRADEDAQLSLRDGYRIAVGVLATSELLRDYHTAQVPGRSALKGRPHRTRRDELAVDKQELNTILSTRDYRQNGDWLVGVLAIGKPRWSLEQIADALRRPHFVLYLGRKSCPLAAPLAPRVMKEKTVKASFDGYLAQIPEAPGLKRLVWSDGVEAGVPADLSVPRKDRLVSRRRWQFGDRIEHSGLLEK